MPFFIFLFRGDAFGKDYANLAMLCATFPTVLVVALTAMASERDVRAIKELIPPFKDPSEVIGNPKHPNIFYN